MVDPERLRRIRKVGYDYDAQPKEHVQICDLCSAREGFVLIAERDRYGFPVRTELCSNCGFAFLNPRLTSKGYATLYERYYRRLAWAYKGRKTPLDAFMVKQQRYAERIDRLLLSDIFGDKRGQDVLDVGGSTGAVGAHFAMRYQSSVTVLDPAPDELAVAEKQGLRSLRGTIEAIEPGDQRYDVILVCQTIHHIPHVDRAFSNLHSMLRPGGHLFVDMVDFLSLCRQRGSVADATHLDHCNSMVDGVMRAFFRKHGFRVIRTDASRPLYFGYVCRADSEPGTPEPYMDVTHYLQELKRIQAEPARPAAKRNLASRLRSAVARRLSRR